jgi:hypothetical protein
MNTGELLSQCKSYRDEKALRWRLVLGDPAGQAPALEGAACAMDGALSALYDTGSDSGRGAGLGGSAPMVARWLGDIRQYFPSTVVRVLQQDALERFSLSHLLLEPEMLEAVEPDVDLLANLIALGSVIPEHSRDTARQVVGKLVAELLERLQDPLTQAVKGALNRSARTRRPRHNDIDWQRTIRANLKHYQADHRTIIPEQLIGFGRKSQSVMQDVILCVDQSGSMATSVVYSSIFAAVLASIRSLSMRLVVFDTAVVDLTEQLADPVDVLFGTQLGGGTDINRAVAYCGKFVTRPADTTLVLITDLYEGGNANALLQRIGGLVAGGVNVVTLLALNDEGAPGYDHRLAAHISGFGVPVFACTPDLFPELMANALQRADIAQWAASQGISLTRAAS